MLNFELRIGLARCRHCTSGHHAAFFTFHFALLTSRRDCFSLPEGTAFHFPQGPRCDSRCSTLRWLVQHAAWAHAPRCGFQASVPRYCTRRHLSGSIAFLHSRSTPQQALGRHAHKYSFAPCISQRHTAPAQPQPPLKREQKRSCHTRKQAVRTSLRISAPPGTVLWGQFCYENLVSLCMRRMAATSLRGHIISISPCSATT